MSAQNVLTPEKMHEAHQLVSLSASPSGSRSLVGVDRFSFDKNGKNHALFLIDLVSDLRTNEGEASRELLTSRTSTGLWLSDEEVLFVDDKTLYVKDVSKAVKSGNGLKHHVPYHADLDQDKARSHAKHSDKHVGIFPSAPGPMRLAPKSDASQATLVFAAQVYSDGDLTRVAEHDKSEEVKNWEDVKAYDSLFVRHWDKWLYPGKRWQLFAIDIKKHGHGPWAAWAFSSPFRNLFNGSQLECPVQPFGDESDFTLSKTHVAWTAKDPSVNAAVHTRQNIYIAPLDSSGPTKQLTSGKQGATSSPSFSPNGAHIVWLQMDVDGFEADRNRIVLQHIPTGTTKTILSEWDLSPSSISFSHDGKSLVGVVEKQGHKVAFTVALHRPAGSNEHDWLDKHDVVFVTDSASVNIIQSLPSSQMLLAVGSMRNPGEVLITKADAKTLPLTRFADANQSPLRDLDWGSPAKHFSYKGSKGREAYGWLLTPPGYSDDAAKHKYPLLVLVHGGPESAWTDSWSKRWNMAAFAAQGYVTVALNPAGSTGYGQAYQEEILGQLGGAPFEDIIEGTRYILDTMPSVDAQRVVAAGASYGGYMMNWINGHNDENLFKGLVCHDGIFSMQGMHATEELYFPEYEVGGMMIGTGKSRENFLRWSPEAFAHKWRTPMLVIHGGQDFRLTESEGLSAFNCLQRLGVASRFVYFPKESHWVNSPKNSLRWHQEVFSWLSRYSQGIQDTGNFTNIPQFVMQS